MPGVRTMVKQYEEMISKRNGPQVPSPQRTDPLGKRALVDPLTVGQPEESSELESEEVPVAPPMPTSRDPDGGDGSKRHPGRLLSSRPNPAYTEPTDGRKWINEYEHEPDQQLIAGVKQEMALPQNAPVGGTEVLGLSGAIQANISGQFDLPGGSGINVATALIRLQGRLMKVGGRLLALEAEEMGSGTPQDVIARGRVAAYAELSSALHELVGLTFLVPIPGLPVLALRAQNNIGLQARLIGALQKTRSTSYSGSEQQSEDG